MTVCNDPNPEVNAGVPVNDGWDYESGDGMVGFDAELREAVGRHLEESDHLNDDRAAGRPGTLEEYDRLTAERARLIDAGASPDELVKPLRPGHTAEAAVRTTVDGCGLSPSYYVVDADVTRWSKTEGGGDDGVDSGALPGQPAG